jgi:DNA gyrase subunit A
MSSLRAGIEQNLKEDDRIIQEYETTTKSDILFFSDKCNVYKMKVHEIVDCKASSMGMYLQNMLGTEENERIISIATTTGYSEYMIFGFVNGKVAKVRMDAYATKVNRKKLVNAYSDRAKIVYAGIIEQDTDFIAISDKNRALMFNTSMLATNTAKNALGVQVLSLPTTGLMEKLVPAEQFESERIDRYRAKTIPAKPKIILGSDKPI